MVYLSAFLVIQGEAINVCYIQLHTKQARKQIFP